MNPLSITLRRNLFAIDQNLLPAASQNFKNACISNLYWGKNQKRYLVQTNQRKIKDLIARFHSWNHLFMCDVAKACSRSAKKRTAWRSCDAQKQSGRCNSQPKLTKFSLNHSSSSCLPASSLKIQDILQQKTMQNSTKNDRVPTKCDHVSWAQFEEFQRWLHTVEFPRGWKRTQSWKVRSCMCNVRMKETSLFCYTLFWKTSQMHQDEKLENHVLNVQNFNAHMM
jgi:hypothetical protein